MTTASLTTIKAVYDMMLDASIEVDGDVDGEMYHVYEGFLSKDMADRLNLSLGTYSPIVNTLKKLECIRNIQRGGGNSPSQWLLIKAPTQQMLLKGKAEPLGLPNGRDSSLRLQVSQQLSALTTRIETLEDLVMQIARAMDMTDATSE